MTDLFCFLGLLIVWLGTIGALWMIQPDKPTYKITVRKIPRPGKSQIQVTKVIKVKKDG